LIQFQNFCVSKWSSFSLSGAFQLAACKLIYLFMFISKARCNYSSTGTFSNYSRIGRIGRDSSCNISSSMFDVCGFIVQLTYPDICEQDFLICIEMFILSVAHHYAFPYKKFHDPKKMPFLYDRNSKRLFANPKSNIGPLFHNFAYVHSFCISSALLSPFLFFQI
jgi:hypothetical protein